MLVLQYDLIASELDIEKVAQVSEELASRFPHETIIALPSGMTLMEMNWEEFDYWEKWLHASAEKLREDLKKEKINEN